MPFSSQGGLEKENENGNYSGFLYDGDHENQLKQEHQNDLSKTFEF